MDNLGLNRTHALGARLSRRAALRTYVPPALAVVAVASAQTYSTTGQVPVSIVGGGSGSVEETEVEETNVEQPKVEETKPVKEEKPASGGSNNTTGDGSNNAATGKKK